MKSVLQLISEHFHLEVYEERLNMSFTFYPLLAGGVSNEHTMRGFFPLSLCVLAPKQLEFP